MKKFIAFIIGLVIFALVGALLWGLSEGIIETAKKSKTVVLKPRKKLAVPEGAYLYEIVDGEAEVMGELISRVLVGTNVTVTYRNKTEDSLRPSYLIRFYNSYGIMVGKKKVGSSSLTDNLMISPNDVSSESIGFERLSVKEALEFSSIKINEDFDIIKWVIISDSNSSIEPSNK